MKYRFLGIAIVLLVMATLACGVNINTGQTPAGPEGGPTRPPPEELPTQAPLPPTQPPPPPTTAADGGGQQGGTATVVLQNNTGQSIFYVYISPTTDTTWGEDRLGSATIPAGGSYTFNVPAGAYDLRAEFSGHTVADQRMDVNLSGVYNWTISGGGGQQGGGGATIVMHNNSGQTVWYAYVSPCSDSNWGSDDLGAATVPNGGTFSFPVSPGCYDMKAEDSSHNSIDVEMGINVSGTYDWYVP